MKGYEDRIVLGLTEDVEVLYKKGKDVIHARIDTGAETSSIDVKLVAELGLGPVTQTKIIKSANGEKLRPAIEVNIIIHGKQLRGLFTIADRSHMRYRILIGQNVLKNGFLIDPTLHRPPKGEEEDIPSD